MELYKDMRTTEHVLVMSIVVLLNLIIYSIFAHQHNKNEEESWRKEQRNPIQSVNAIHEQFLAKGIELPIEQLAGLVNRHGFSISYLKYNRISLGDVIASTALLGLAILQLWLGVEGSLYLMVTLKEEAYGWFMLGFFLYPIFNLTFRLVAKVADPATGFYTIYGCFVQAFGIRMIFLFLECGDHQWDDFLILLCLKLIYKLIASVIPDSSEEVQAHGHGYSFGLL